MWVSLSACCRREGQLLLLHPIHSALTRVEYAPLKLLIQSLKEIVSELSNIGHRTVTCLHAHPIYIENKSPVSPADSFHHDDRCDMFLRNVGS
jgi:hypothetical protein